MVTSFIAINQQSVFIIQYSSFIFTQGGEGKEGQYVGGTPGRAALQDIAARVEGIRYQQAQKRKLDIEEVRGLSPPCTFTVFLLCRVPTLPTLLLYRVARIRITAHIRILHIVKGAEITKELQEEPQCAVIVSGA